MTKKRMAVVATPVAVLIAVGFCLWLPGLLLHMALQPVVRALEWLVGRPMVRPAQLPAKGGSGVEQWG